MKIRKEIFEILMCPTFTEDMVVEGHTTLLTKSNFINLNNGSTKNFIKSDCKIVYSLSTIGGMQFEG